MLGNDSLSKRLLTAPDIYSVLRNKRGKSLPRITVLEKCTADLCAWVQLLGTNQTTNYFLLITQGFCAAFCQGQSCISLLVFSLVLVQLFVTPIFCVNESRDNLTLS